MTASASSPATGVASCWGEGAQYRLGTGTENVEAAPREIPDLVDVSRLSLGARHSGAVLASGEVLLWGDNTRGQLGDGVPHEPVDVVSLREEELAEVGTVLTADPHDERPTRHARVD